MEVGNYNKPAEFTQRILTVGKIKYIPIAVNPSKKELEMLRDQRGLNIFVPNEEPIYFGSQALDTTKPNEKTPYFDVTVYMRSSAFSDNIDRVIYRVFNTGRVSSSKKFEVINAYGNTAWLEKSHVDAKTVPQAMDWFVTDGMKILRRGEASLVSFIRALRNLKNVQKDTPEKELYRSIFNDKDLQGMMKGDFKNIRNVIMEVPDAQITFVTGVRFVNDKKYQDLYRDLPLRSYVADTDGSDDFIKKTISEAQTNGAYANTNFFLTSLNGREYMDGMENPSRNTSSHDDFTFETADDSIPFQNAQEAEDDLPF